MDFKRHQNLYSKVLKKASFQAAYRENPDGEEIPVKIAKMNKSQQVEDSTGFSRESKEFYLMDSSYVDGFVVSDSDYLIVDGDDLLINYIEKIRIGGKVVSYLLGVIL